MFFSLLSQGEQKLSAIEAKVDRVITKELEDVRQSLQDVIECQEEKIMKEIQLLKKVYYIINSYHVDH